ncbi:hypothetical protein GCM10023219_30140 [Stakelama sediminis]
MAVSAVTGAGFATTGALCVLAGAEAVLSVLVASVLRLETGAVCSWGAGSTVMAGTAGAVVSGIDVGWLAIGDAVSGTAVLVAGAVCVIGSVPGITGITGLVAVGTAGDAVVVPLSGTLCVCVGAGVTIGCGVCTSGGGTSD